jgi:hypothetical protein
VSIASFSRADFCFIHQGQVADLIDGAIAAPATKDEIDGGQHVPLLQLGQHKGNADAVPAAPAALLLRLAPLLFLQKGVQPRLLIIQQRP